MEVVFIPHSLTIKKLFGDSSSLYQIPVYQRPYKWGTEQVDKLWEDLWEAYQNDESHYFLGSIITAQPEEKNSYLDVVDGQQRLTTLLILFCCYRDRYPSINSHTIESDNDAVDSYALNNSILYNNRLKRLRLITHSNHQSDFDNLILSGKTEECKFPSKKDLARDEEPKFKFENTAAIFHEWLSDLDEETAGKFLNYIFNKVQIIRIDCSTVSFAIKLFQVLNDRGLELTNSDLIKSFLLEKVYKNYALDKTIQKIKVEQFLSDWKETEGFIKQTDISLNEAFILYEYYLKGANPKQSLYDELQNLLESQDPNVVIADFKTFCGHYFYDIHEKEDKLLYSFWYLRWSIYWKSILLTAIHTNYPDYRGLMKLLRRYYYLSWIAGFTLSKIKQVSFNIIKWIKDKQPLSFIEKEIRTKMEADYVIRRATEVLDGDIYYMPWAKALFFLIEYNQSDDSNLSFYYPGDRDIHLEHILPRKYYSISGWNYFKTDQSVGDWINSGANLTLLSGKKNIEASNNDFEVKISVYTGKGKYKKDDNKISAFRITQKVVDDYHSNKFSKEWDWDAINDRWIWFCDQVEELFDIDLEQLKKGIHENKDVAA